LDIDNKCNLSVQEMSAYFPRPQNNESLYAPMHGTVTSNRGKSRPVSSEIERGTPGSTPDDQSSREEKTGTLSPSISNNGRNERKVEISEADIVKLYNCPQPTAALLLGCSLSSLKRRYYEITKRAGQPGKRWPYQSLTIKQRKQYIYYVLNHKEPDCKYLDEHTIETLKKAFSSNTIQNDK
jgi:hypothetical protein